MLPSATSLLALLLALLVGGCALEDRVEIPERPATPTPEPTPEPEQPASAPTGSSSSSARLGTVLVLVEAAPPEREEYDTTLEDGTHVSGWYDPGTGEFDLAYDYPGQDPDDIDRLQQAGAVHLEPHDPRPDTEAPAEVLGSGEYRETQTFNSGATFIVDYGYAAFAGHTAFWGRSPDGDEVQGELRPIPGGRESTETWHEPEVYRLRNLERFYDDGRYYGEYEYDDLTSDTSPDQTGHTDLQADGTGRGYSESWDEDGTLYTYDYVIEADGSLAGDFTVDDPSTAPNPDIVGTWTQDGATGETRSDYTLYYPDGTALLVTDLSHPDGTTDQTYTWDDPDTPFSPDVRGSFHYAADGSGTGSVTAYAADGSTTVCDYELAAGGRVLEEDCHPGAAGAGEVPTKQRGPA